MVVRVHVTQFDRWGNTPVSTSRNKRRQHLLLARDGKILYQKQGSVDMLELRRTILANLPSDYDGFNKYWLGP
jgi:hypothetical protein